jgi:cell wall-associated NlpC family hydrolase
LAEAARRYIGTPWIHQGRLHGKGCDCVGVLMGAAQECGVKMRDVTNYPTQPNRQWLLDELRKQFIQVDLPGAQLGDLLAFAWGPIPWHVGIITRLAPLTMVHAWRQVDRCVEMRLDESWRRRICGVWRFPEAC